MALLAQERVLAAALFDSEFEPIARTILSKSFFEFKNMVDIVVMLLKTHGQMTRPWLNDSGIGALKLIKDKGSFFLLKMNSERALMPQDLIFPPLDHTKLPLQSFFLSNGRTVHLRRESPYQIAANIPKEHNIPTVQDYLRLVPAEKKFHDRFSLSHLLVTTRSVVARRMEAFFERMLFLTTFCKKQ